MILSSKEQLVFMLYTFSFGIVSFLIYDFIRILRIIFSHSYFTIQAEDLLFWLICSVCFFKLTLYLSNGKIRFYMFLSFIVGAGAYRAVFSQYIMNTAKEIINIFKKIFSFLLKIIQIPKNIVKNFVLKANIIFCSIFKKLLILCPFYAKIKYTLNRLNGRIKLVKNHEGKKKKKKSKKIKIRFK